MIRAGYTDDEGRTHYVFGLSWHNLHRLREGQPIRVDLKELGGKDGSVVIFVGRNEREMEQMLRDGGMVGPETNVRKDPRLS